jgi:hypothetical protein
LVPLSQNRRLRAHTAGVCFASRTERPPPLASEATLGDEREANPGRYRPLTVFDRGKGKAAGSLHGRRLCCMHRFQQVFLIEKLSAHPTKAALRHQAADWTSPVNAARTASSRTASVKPRCSCSRATTRSRKTPRFLNRYAVGGVPDGLKLRIRQRTCGDGLARAADVNRYPAKLAQVSSTDQGGGKRRAGVSRGVRPLRGPSAGWT